MKLTEEEFEKIFNQIKDDRKLNFSSLEGFDNFEECDKTRIINEWTIYGDENYKIELATKVIKNNDGEPYTESRIQRELNISYSLAKIIKEYVLDIEDDK